MKTKLILFITVFLLSASLKSQNVKIENDYKNSLSVDVGSFAMLNYHRRIFRKNWYALNGQVGVGIGNDKQCNADLLVYINENAYFNNLFTIKKHEIIVGFGGERVIYCNQIDLMGKIGYQYNIYHRFSLNFTLYHWIWTKYNCDVQGPAPRVCKYWLWQYPYSDWFDPFFSFGINFYF